jgi:hypothetical protein
MYLTSLIIMGDAIDAKDLRTAERNPSLQHRHFAVIAAALRESKPMSHWDANKHAQWQSTVNSFIAACRRSNPRFDYSRCLDACNWTREGASE